MKNAPTILIVACIALSCNPLLTFGVESSTEISCEGVRMFSWFFGKDKTCFVNERTSIESDDTRLAIQDDETITGFWPQENKKIKFLPIEIYKSFPNLNALDAVGCSISVISKKNFEKLDKLTGLFLDRNHIATVYSDTFEDLTSLKRLSFKENPLKNVNAKAFLKLNQLQSVWMMKNECIDVSFQTWQTPRHPEDIEKNCGFDESVREATTTTWLIEADDDETTEKPWYSGLPRGYEAIVVGLAIFVIVFSVLCTIWMFSKMCC